MADGFTSGELTLGGLKADVERAKAYWADPADSFALAFEYRRLMAVKARGELLEGEEAYTVETFVRDAMRHNISQGELIEGMEVYRDHGGPFLPRTFGDWLSVRVQHVFVTGKERANRYAAVVRDIEARSQDTTAAGDVRHETDMAGRTRDLRDLMDLTRRHKARCHHNLSSLPCILSDLKAILTRVQGISEEIRTDIENEAIRAAEYVIKLRRKSA